MGMAGPLAASRFKMRSVQGDFVGGAGDGAQADLILNRDAAELITAHPFVTLV